MVTSVKVSDETKSSIERLQAEIRLETGVKVTQQEVLARLVEQAFDSREAFIDSFREERVPVSEEDREAFHSEMGASGVETTEEDIDDVIYG